MSAKNRKNIVASVLAKLPNRLEVEWHAVSTGSSAIRYGALPIPHLEIEACAKCRSEGALLLKTIGIPNARPTMDIDMLRTGKADQASLLSLVKDCATLDVAADGLDFIADSAVAEEIAKDSEYKGTRILMDARMDNVRLKIQIDFGVGDVMVPGPRMIEYPVFLGGDTIELLAYPVESAIAEKLQAMVALGNANSRMKDFYDVWICSTHLDLNGKTLLKAIDATFKNLQTHVPVEEFEAFSPDFVRAHRLQWNAFVNKMGEEPTGNAFNVYLTARLTVSASHKSWLSPSRSCSSVM